MASESSRVSEDLAGRVDAVSRLHGRFVLRSGRTATEYFDKDQFESDPGLLDELTSALVPLVPAGSPGLGGWVLGGVGVWGGPGGACAGGGAVGPQGA